MGRSGGSPRPASSRSFLCRLSGQTGLSPQGIAAGPDGDLWFTEDLGRKIGRITPTGEIAVYPLPTTYDRVPVGITAGPDGNVWFAESPSAIGRITPAGAVTEYKLPYISYPVGITAGPDGNLWYTARHKVGMISPTATPILKWTCPEHAPGPN